MPNVTLYLIAGVAFMVALAGAGIKGYNMGEDHVRAEYAKRDLQQANEAAAATKAVEEKYRAQEQAHSQALAQVSTDYERKLTDANATKNLALDSIKHGALKLRLTDPVTAPCGSPDSKAATSTSGPDGSGTGQFLGETDATFLVTEASRADAIVLRLGACQAALTADRK